MKKSILVILLWFVAGSVHGADVHEVDLTDPDRRQAYRATTHLKLMSNMIERGIFRGSPVVVMDINADGFDLFVKSNNHYISAVSDANNHAVTHFQTNLPPKFSREKIHAFTVTEVGDLDGDGAPDLVIGGVTEDFWTWGFWVMEPATGAIKSHFELKGFSEIREDGYWDGNFGVVGAIDCPVDDIPRRALVLTVNVGFDIEGRGILAVDPWTGEVLWHFLMGPNPMPDNCSLTDLNHDGQKEVVIVGRSPDNLGGRPINGFSDDETRLFVINNLGELQWTQPMGPAFGNGTLQVHDLDGDGFQEIMTTAQSTPKIWGEIVVWSATGEALVRHEDSQQYTFSRFLPARNGHPNQLIVTAANNQALLFDVTPEKIDLVARASLGSGPAINGLLDILPEPGPELVLSTREGAVWILGDMLAPLASLRLDPSGYYSRVLSMKPDSTKTYLSWTDRPRPSLTFSPTPRPMYQNPLVAGPTLLALASLLVVGVRTLARRPRLDPATLRELRLSLLEDLELSGHGAMAPLRSLRRLLWNLGALESGLGDRVKVTERVRSTWQECSENSLPNLRGILDRSKMAGLSADNIRYAERVLDRLDTTFGELADREFTGPELDGLTSSLSADTAKAEDALQDLRREVAEFFRTSLKDQLVRVLRANEEALEEAHITLRTGFLSVATAGSGGLAETMAEPQHCLIDPDELGFVLDNLIGNAIRAMDGAAVRNLNITWSAIDGMLMTDVTDTGCGIDPDDHQRILDTRYSSREGGGHGLPRSRKILRKYGGSLIVHLSEPGRGSTLRLTLPLA